MSDDLYLVASYREVKTLHEYAGYLSHGLGGAPIQVCDEGSLLTGILEERDIERLARVFDSIETSMWVKGQTKGYRDIVIPGKHALALELLRHSLSAQRVGVRTVKEVGSLIQRMAAAIAFPGRWVVEA